MSLISSLDYPSLSTPTTILCALAGLVRRDNDAILVGLARWGSVRPRRRAWATRLTRQGSENFDFSKRCGLYAGCYNNEPSALQTSAPGSMHILRSYDVFSRHTPSLLSGQHRGRSVHAYEWKASTNCGTFSRRASHRAGMNLLSMHGYACFAEKITIYSATVPYICSLKAIPSDHVHVWFRRRRRRCCRFCCCRLFSFKIVRLQSSLTLEATHKRLHGALDTFNSQMMKPPLPVSPVGSNASTPNAEGALRSAGATPPRRRRRRSCLFVIRPVSCILSFFTIERHVRTTRGGSRRRVEIHERGWCH